MLKEKKGDGSKKALLLTKVKPWTGPTNVEIHNGSNTYVNEGVDPLDHKHDKKRHKSLWKQSRKGKSSNGLSHGEQATRPGP